MYGFFDSPMAFACTQVPSDRDSPLPLPAHLLHTLAHIELNAIDLAWDTVVRFAPLRLPDGFYTDFARCGEQAWIIKMSHQDQVMSGGKIAQDLDVIEMANYVPSSAV